eukprot:s401_g30.t1
MFEIKKEIAIEDDEHLEFELLDPYYTLENGLYMGDEDVKDEGKGGSEDVGKAAEPIVGKAAEPFVGEAAEPSVGEAAEPSVVEAAEPRQLALRKPMLAKPTTPAASDVADTLPFEASQLALECQQEASPVVIADSQTDDDGHPSVREPAKTIDPMELPLLLGSGGQEGDQGCDGQTRGETTLEKLGDQKAETGEVERAMGELDKTSDEHANDKNMETRVEEKVEENKLEGDGDPENHKTDVGETVEDKQLETGQVAKNERSIFSDEEEEVEDGKPEAGGEQETHNTVKTALEETGEDDEVEVVGGVLPPTGAAPEEGEPPLVRRVDQWEQKPKAKAKAKAKGKAKSQPKAKAAKVNKEPEAKAKAKVGRRRKKTEEIEVVASGDEKECPEGAPKPARKKRVSKKAKATVAESGSNEVQQHDPASDKNKDSKEPPIKYEPVTHEGKSDLSAAYQWGGKGEEGEDQAPEAPAEAEPVPPAPKRQRLELTTFARRPCPKVSPNKERWFVIRDIFRETVEPAVCWWEWCMEHLDKDEAVKPAQLRGLETAEITEKWQKAVETQLVAFMSDSQLPH